MLKCNKCNNSITDNDAKFCDKCGEFLALTDKKIKFKKNISNKKLDEFKRVLIESVDTIFDSRVDSTWYNDIIMSYLIDLTNISKIFKHDEMNFVYINSILSLLKRCDKDLIVYEFLLKVNEDYESHKEAYEKELLQVIIYTNIDKKLKENDNFNKILKFFNLEIFEFSDFAFNENQENYDDNFDLGLSMFKFSNKTRDSELLKSQALNEIYALFGYLTYLNKFNKTTNKSHINELVLINQISDFECNALIVINEENEILDIGYQNEVITNSKNINKSKINKIKSPELIKDFNNVDKWKISKNIKYYFHLYYRAAYESILENSFLKFWALSEKIIKDIYGGIKDDKLKKAMKNILKAHPYPKYLIKRIDFLHRKRNDLVHENKHGDITQYDQTLIKVISERLIEFLINFMDNLKYMEEYGVILDYLNKEDDEKKRFISLIELTIVDSDDD